VYVRMRSDGDTRSKIGTATFHGQDPSDVEVPLTSEAGGGWHEDTEDGKSCARARAFNKVLRFFSRAASSYTVRRECLTAAAESHAGLHTKLTFPPTAVQSFYPFHVLPSGASSRCSYFSLWAPFRPRILHPLRFLRIIPSQRRFLAWSSVV